MKQSFCCYRNGLKIVGTVFLPNNQKESLPAVIISHEFMANRFFSYPYARSLAKEGYAVFCYDFCGGGIISASDGSTAEMSVLTEVEDLKTVIAYAESLPYINKDELILMGCSQGSFVSAMVASQLGAKIKKLILFYPALSIPDDARKGKMLMAEFDPNQIPQTLHCGVMSLGKCYVEDVIEIEPYSIISDYRGDVLIVHGTADGLVDISYSRRAVTAYKEVAPERMVYLKELAGAGHIFLRKKHIRDAVNTVKEFLSGYIELTQVDVRLSGVKLRYKKSGLAITLPFKGTATGLLFSGEVTPGASDERIYPMFRKPVICAKYKLTGTDCFGNQCSVFVENRAEKGHWRPRIKTDSTALGFTEGIKGHAYVHQRGLKGPIVRLFIPSITK